MHSVCLLSLFRAFKKTTLETKKIVIKEKEILEVKKKVETIKTDIIKPKLKPKPKNINNEIFILLTKIDRTNKLSILLDIGYLRTDTMFSFIRSVNNLTFQGSI